jgi:hypothetical protein
MDTGVKGLMDDEEQHLGKGGVRAVLKKLFFIVVSERVM